MYPTALMRDSMARINTLPSTITKK
jgi:hypothetical protein